MHVAGHPKLLPLLQEFGPRLVETETGTSSQGLPVKLRIHAAEAAIAGKPVNEETAKMAGEIAIQGAQPLAHNEYKIPLMRNLVKRAVAGATA